jgi:hypothetical protein
MRQIGESRTLVACSTDVSLIFDVLLCDACDRVFVHLPALPASRLSDHGQAHPQFLPFASSFRIATTQRV